MAVVTEGVREALASFEATSARWKDAQAEHERQAVVIDPIARDANSALSRLEEAGPQPREVLLSPQVAERLERVTNKRLGAMWGFPIKVVEGLGETVGVR